MTYIAYKQTIKHINENDLDINSLNIYEMPSNICKSYYYPERDKMTSVNDVLKLSPRFYFSFVCRGFEKRTFIKHCCYFDSFEMAEVFRNKLMSCSART